MSFLLNTSVSMAEECAPVKYVWKCLAFLLAGIRRRAAAC